MLIRVLSMLMWVGLMFVLAQSPELTKGEQVIVSLLAIIGMLVGQVDITAAEIASGVEKLPSKTDF